MAESIIGDRLQESALAQGSVVGGKFVVKRFLAQGGMGRVYVAEQQPMARKVALKVMRRDLADDDSAVRRFLREAVAVSKLQHPNTVTLFDYGESADGSLYIAMEYLDGLSLKEVLARDHRLPLRRVARIVAQVALSLSEAHRKGVIHRDLKPDNIFLLSVEGRPDFVKVIDFGIAHLQSVRPESRITRAGFVCGTPEYMSPEQARGDEIDARADLYSLGVIVFELLEGEIPYDAATPLGIVLKHQAEPVPRLSGRYPAPFVDLVERLMAKDPDQRPDTAEMLLRELQGALPRGVGLTGLEIDVDPVRQGTLPAAPVLAETVRRAGGPGAAGEDLADVLTSTPPEGTHGDRTTAEAIIEARLFEPRLRRRLWLSAALFALVLAAAALLWPSRPDPERLPPAMTGLPAAAGHDAPVTDDAEGSGDQAEVPEVPAQAAATALVSVTVASVPARARLHIDGNYLGLTPLPVELSPERAYDVVLILDGYQDHQIELVVTPDQQGQTIGPIHLRSRRASIRITTEPEGVEVVDGVTGESWGQTELSREVPRSDQPITLRFTRPRYRTVERTVLPNQPQIDLHVDMSRAHRSDPETSDPEPPNQSPFGPPVD